jgi:carbonic anhydrase
MTATAAKPAGNPVGAPDEVARSREPPGNEVVKIVADPPLVLPVIQHRQPTTETKNMRDPTIRHYHPALVPFASNSLLLAALLAISSAAAAGSYTVVAGDTHFRIARAHDVAVEGIRLADGLTSNRFHAGQKLVIPLEERVLAEDDDEDSEQGERSAVESRLAIVGQTGMAAAGGAGGKGKKESDEADTEDQASAEQEEEGQASATAQEEVEAAGAVASESESSPDEVATGAAAEAATGECVAKVAEQESHESTPHWTYEGEAGPEHWAELSPKFEKCGTGTRQTPIDLASSEVVPMGLEDVEFQYGTVEATVLNNGHTVQVNVPEGNFIVLDGVTYGLAQFHFHSPSEHTIDGASYPLELHLVHKDETGNLAVVGVMLEKGEKNRVLAQVWGKSLPKSQGKEIALKAPIDLNGLLPADRSAYRYLGSLTTPPCSEGVKWIVMKSSVTMTTKQIAAFKKLFPMNARPLQPINARSIVEDVTQSAHAAN